MEILTVAAAGVGALRSPVVAADVSGKLDSGGESSSCRRRATVRGVNTETIARPRPIRLTQARIGDTLYDDGNGTRVAVVNAFTTVNPETDTTVRAVDYQVVGAAPDQFRLYSDDERDVARWRRAETAASQ